MGLGFFSSVLPCVLISVLIWAMRQRRPERTRYLTALGLGGLTGLALITCFTLSASPFVLPKFLLYCLVAAPLGGLIALGMRLVSEGDIHDDLVR